MNDLTNSIQNSILAKAPAGVLSAIKQASARTGVNFAYLVEQANAESSFKPEAKAKTSSATGLYQFIESTWLNMVKKYGHKYGMAEQAQKIHDNGNVTSRAARSEILALRKDPEKAALMAAEFASENEKFLHSNWGGKVGSTELYLAHFMGAGGAASFLRAHDANPAQPASTLFPAAAKANRNVFYDTATGRAKSLAEVYAFFDKKFSSDTISQDIVPVPDTKDEPLLTASAQEKPGYYNSVLYQIYGRPKPMMNSLGVHNLVQSPVELMIMAKLDSPFPAREEKKSGNYIYNQ